MHSQCLSLEILTSDAPRRLLRRRGSPRISGPTTLGRTSPISWSPFRTGDTAGHGRKEESFGSPRCGEETVWEWLFTLRSRVRRWRLGMATQLNSRKPPHFSPKLDSPSVLCCAVFSFYHWLFAACLLFRWHVFGLVSSAWWAYVQRVFRMFLHVGATYCLSDGCWRREERSEPRSKRRWAKLVPMLQGYTQ
jgi:hypothetical protein